MKLEPGMQSQQTYSVRADDLALHWGGEMPVLATPVLIGLFEKACVAATDHCLTQDRITVGMGIDVLHISPVTEGTNIEIRARLDSVDGKKLKFCVEAYDARGLVATGRIYRSIVGKAAFMTKVCQKVRPASNGPLNELGHATPGTAS